MFIDGAGQFFFKIFDPGWNLLPDTPVAVIVYDHSETMVFYLNQEYRVGAFLQKSEIEICILDRLFKIHVLL
jgi:hypothetical protein